MASLSTLEKLFAELEHEADAAPLPEPLHLRPARAARGRRLMLPAASAACVLAAVGFGGYLAARPSGHHRVQAGALPGTTATSTQPATRPTTSPTTRPTAHLVFPPATGDQLTAEAQQVLGATAKLSPVQSDATSSVGTLGAGGVSGGYQLDLVMPAAGEPLCLSDVPTCARRTLPDGSRLAVQTIPLQTDPGGVSYHVAVARPDGVMIDFIVSNAADPKGAGPVAAHVPLTTDQMVAFVTSPAWDSFR